MKKRWTNKATTQDYELYKSYLHGLNLSPAEYETKLKEWVHKNGY